MPSESISRKPCMQLAVLAKGSVRVSFFVRAGLCVFQIAVRGTVGERALLIWLSKLANDAERRRLAEYLKCPSSCRLGFFDQ